MLRFRILILCLTFSASCLLLKGQHIVNINDLTSESQLMTEDPDLLQMVWYIPLDFWESVFNQDPSIADADAKEILDALDDYELIAVADGKIGVFGNVDYRDKDVIKAELELIGVNGLISKPLDESRVNKNTSAMLSMMSPMLTNMMGDLGSNMHFYLFDAKKDGKSIATPKSEGTMTVKLGEVSYTYEFPFGSLLPPKICPVDDKKMNGAWNYCPKHGKELKTN